MNRQIGFYLLTPGLSIYILCLFQLLYVSYNKFKQIEITEPMFILTIACLFIFLPLALYVIKIGNYYAPLFKTKKQFWSLLIPVFVLSIFTIIF